VNHRVIGEIVAECFVQRNLYLAHLLRGRQSRCPDYNLMFSNLYNHSKIFPNLVKLCLRRGRICYHWRRNNRMLLVRTTNRKK